MCKKLLFLISLCLVLGLVSNSFADVMWEDDDPCDHLWRSPENWSGNAVPLITQAAKYNDPCVCGPVIDSTHVGPNEAVCESYRIGDANAGCDMNITGGVMSFQQSDAFYEPARFFIGVDDSDGVGTVNMSGGVVTCQFMAVGWMALGHLNMTGGTINITDGKSTPYTNAGYLAIPGAGGIGYVNLYGGTINCQDIAMAPYAGGGGTYTSDGTSRLDLKGSGKLVLNGDKIATVTLYVNSGLITGDGDPRYTKIQYDGSETTVTYEANPDLAVAWGAIPLDYQVGVPLATTLVWSPGDYAADTNGHHVYFGTSWSDVNSGAAGVDKGIQDANQYPESGTVSLEVGREYFWAVDECNDACDPCLWPGKVWRFTAIGREVWDDFDQYGSEAAVEAVWQEQAGTGADVLRQTGWPRFPGQNAGVGMKFRYDNSGTKYYSEVKREIADANKDWTRGGQGGIKELDLWFAGDKDNVTTGIFGMYAAVEDKDGHLGVVNYGDHGEDISDLLNDHGTGQWLVPDDPEFWPNVTTYRCWHIRLADFNENSGVNLADVNNFYLGIGDRTNSSVSGGAGEVWFEEFRFYLPRCLAYYEETTIGDLSGDCVVDFEDVKEMQDEWLAKDYNTPTSNPGTGNLLAYYQFEGDYTDSSGNGRNGTAVNNVDTVYDADRDCNVLELPGSGDYVNIGGGSPCDTNTWADVNGPITLAAWFKRGDLSENWQPIVAKGEGAWRLQTYDLFGLCFSCTGVGEGEEWGIEICGGEYVNDGQWHHGAGVYDPNADGDGTGKMYLYANGYLVSSHDANGVISKGYDSNDVTLGGNFDDLPNTFDGYIDEVRIYNKALSQQEVAYLAGDGANPFRSRSHTVASLHSDPNNTVDLKDFAVMAADDWLERQFFGD